ncbi:MAG: hypothetical protein QOJ25_1781 [Solirubrobacteraceae bacterium]|jgi:DNA-binding PadR family transcriptional regulator|nr:hypothetical protein [Solirubrobacteraceae bacterium]
MESKRIVHPDRRPHWRFTEPAVLVLLADGPAHGYELRARLTPLFPADAGPPDASGIYRLLHRLEGDGTIRSTWAEPGPGPARRVYEITDSGRDALAEWASAIASELQALSGLLAAFYRAGAGRGTSQADA